MVLLLIALVCVGQIRAGDAIQPPLKSYRGLLKTGVVAIGGETTRVTLTTKTNGVFELDLKSAELKKTGEGLNGKQVVVVGEYKPRPGVEIKERRIIEVKTLSAATN